MNVTNRLFPILMGLCVAFAAPSCGAALSYQIGVSDSGFAGFSGDVFNVVTGEKVTLDVKLVEISDSPASDTFLLSEEGVSMARIRAILNGAGGTRIFGATRGPRFVTGTDSPDTDFGGGPVEINNASGLLSPVRATGTGGDSREIILGQLTLLGGQVGTSQSLTIDFEDPNDDDNFLLGNRDSLDSSIRDTGGFAIATVNVTAVPEPSSCVLLATLSVALLRRRARRQRS